MRSVVVLPAPFGPRKPTISPGCTVRSMPRTASTVPRLVLKDFARPLASIIGSRSADGECDGAGGPDDAAIGVSWDLGGLRQSQETVRQGDDKVARWKEWASWGWVEVEFGAGWGGLAEAAVDVIGGARVASAMPNMASVAPCSTMRPGCALLGQEERALVGDAGRLLHVVRDDHDRDLVRQLARSSPRCAGSRSGRAPSTARP